MRDLSDSIKLLVVDDSGIVRSDIAKKLAADPEIEVVGTALDCVDALEQVKRLKPDVITMDVTMPQLDGLGASSESWTRAQRRQSCSAR